MGLTNFPNGVNAGSELQIGGVKVDATAAELSKLKGAVATPVVAEEVTFTETAGAGTYTGTVNVPAGATLLDIIVHQVVLWTAATSATMKVGDAADDDGFFTAVDLKATDLLADEALSLTAPGGQQGAYVVPGATDDAYQVSKRWDGSARAIKGIVTTVGASGDAGRTRMIVVYAAPVAADIVAATKA